MVFVVAGCLPAVTGVSTTVAMVGGGFVATPALAFGVYLLALGASRLGAGRPRVAGQGVEQEPRPG